MKTSYNFIPYKRHLYPESEMKSRSKDFYDWANKRRTVREFSSKEIPQEVVDNILLTANTAPSGANKQPWTFCVVSDPAIKKIIRTEAEKEEKISYDSRMSEEYDIDSLWHEYQVAVGDIKE